MLQQLHHSFSKGKSTYGQDLREEGVMDYFGIRGLFCFRGWSFCLYFKSMYLNLEIRKKRDLAKRRKLVFDLTKKEKLSCRG